MNIWIDILHIPQYNFYKQFILRLAGEGHFIHLTILKRGKLDTIVRRELKDVQNLAIYTIGKHRMTKFSALFEVNVWRPLQIFCWKFNKKIDIAFSNGYVCALVCWFNRIKNFAFDDDPQTFDYKPKIWFSNKSHYCLYHLPADYKLSPKVSVLRTLKEWAYLAPSVYKPNISALDEYALKPKEYVFLREVSVGTVNYTGQASGAILNVANFIPKDKKVLLSLEDKSKRDLYPKEWILLQEPLKDVHSLIYYSAGLASSGDSMAREAALLGVPAYYLGIRHSMPANLAAADVADFNNEVTMPFSEWVNKLNLTADELKKNQAQTRTQVNEKFIDLNEYMYRLVKG